MSSNNPSPNVDKDRFAYPILTFDLGSERPISSIIFSKIFFLRKVQKNFDFFLSKMMFNFHCFTHSNILGSLII